MLQDLNSLEYKIVWELETWKKSEEAKFKYHLKKKEIEFMQNLQQKWRDQEKEKQKVFKRSEAKL